MNIPTRIAVVVFAFSALSGLHRAQAETAIKIGVLNDLSGPYADVSGKGSVIAAQMAADDFAKEAGSSAPKIEILSADHQNKADIGALIARTWIDRDGVAAIVDVPNSAVALAVNQIMREKDRAFLASSTATSDLTGSQCAPTTVQWTFDTWALANGTARAVVEQGGLKWFFIGANYALGAALVRDATAVIKAYGGTVLGDVRAPLGTSDLSSYLLQAQSSGAEVIGTANGGDDLINTVKQASEFGVGRDGKQRFAGLLVFLTDVKGMGLQTAQGLLLTEAFYWDLNDQTRAWSRRFAERNGGKMPTMNHAGVYSETMAFLRAAVSIGGISGQAIVARMKATPIDDPLFGPTEIRADGRAVHAMYLFRVKAPASSKGPYDLYDLVSTIPAAQAFRPMDQGGCPLVVSPGGGTK
jgi:branched-chain amino acid transport system substrate-binding protein